ncbi:DgyrCDS1622 [Dimorphilus gyrociliatus]|uniref:Eukaryotic translation initiation factor 3 subunit H n=1 Tax=Dimorphilus gyrociliatus TaxID=2664684 RepID=A0A7I8VB36_9ANNE|nr:DgyrCDS1622 [Dimorphilus gyrociliatus]
MSASDPVQGVLLGLIEGTKLEVTNCFPIPKTTEEDDFDEMYYQIEVIRKLRHVNVDHLSVGWYQSNCYGSFINKGVLESQFNYQNSIEESIVLIYDPIKSSKGKLSLKALRLTPVMMQFFNEGKYTPEDLKKTGTSFDNMFEEVDIVIKTSNLTSALCCELGEIMPSGNQYGFLDLGMGNLLEKKLKLLMDCVDELSQDSSRFFSYQRQCQKQQQQKQQALQKRFAENKARSERGEAPLPDDDIHKQFKPIAVPPRLDSLLVSSQIASFAEQIDEFANQSFGKLFMGESLLPKEESGSSGAKD